MKQTIVLPALLGILFAACPLRGETLVMKDGTTIEGTISSETDEYYLILVNVTATIKEEKSVKKADVLRVKRDAVDLQAFNELKDLVPTPDLLSAADYRARIGRLEAFMKANPKSVYLADVKKMIAVLNEESKQIEAGGQKIDGAILTPRDYAANAYELDAAVIEREVREQAAQSNLVGALRAFRKMEPTFVGTAPYRDVLPLVNTVLRSYAGQLQPQVDSYDDRIKARENGLSNMTTAERALSMRALEAEAVDLQKRYDKEKANGIVWATPHPYHKQSMDEALALTLSELQRLRAAAADAGPDRGKVYRETLAALSGAVDQEAKDAALATAREAQIPDAYLKKLEAAAK